MMYTTLPGVFIHHCISMNLFCNLSIEYSVRNQDENCNVQVSNVFVTVNFDSVAFLGIW